MSDSKGYDGERLPWIKGPYDADPTGGSVKRALVSLLALFLIAGVVLISYLAGRVSRVEPVSLGRETPPAPRPVPITLPPTLSRSASPSQSEVMTPPSVGRLIEPQSKSAVINTDQQVEKQSAMTVTKARRSPRAPEFRPPRRVREARRALAQPQRVLYASRVVQLGQYPNRRQAEAAHGRLIRVYPYLKTLPKMVTSWRAPSGGARAHFLRLQAYSPDHARILCQNLIAIGRGCAVLPERP